LLASFVRKIQLTNKFGFVTETTGHGGQVKGPTYGLGRIPNGLSPVVFVCRRESPTLYSMCALSFFFVFLL